MFCPAANIVTEICLSTQCDSTLMCGSEDCNTCHHQHARCDSGARRLTRVTDTLKELASTHSALVSKTSLIDDAHIKQMRVNQEEFSKVSEFYNMKKENQTILGKIYSKKEWTNINGNQTKNLMEDINLTTAHYNKNASKALDEYEAGMNRLTKEAEALKTKLLETLNPEIEKNKRRQS